MVLYEGRYSGILQPRRHFMPLRKDFANFAEVRDFLRDHRRMQEMADRTFEEIARNPAYSYRRFTERFDAEVEQAIASRGLQPPTRAYSRARSLGQLARSPSYVAHRVYSRTLQWLLLGTPLRPLIFRIWGAVPRSVRQFARPFLRLIGR
jgi:hypothetical protein